jgi:RimJ/RimL family protein N-acetyltransferase
MWPSSSGSPISALVKSVAVEALYGMVMKPAFETDRLTIRPLERRDASALAKIYGDPRRPDYLGERRADPDEHRRRIEERRAEGDLDSPLGTWAVETREDGEVVGVAILRPLEDGEEIEIGWHLDPDTWGSGFATESARAVLTHAFGTVGLEQVVAVIDPRNDRSRRVAERLGMRPDGSGHYYGYLLDRFVIDSEDHRVRSTDS